MRSATLVDSFGVAKQHFAVVWFYLLRVFGREQLAHVSTIRAGVLEKKMHVVYQGHMAQLLSWTPHTAKVALLCFTAGTGKTCDRSMSGSKLTVGLDTFRRATADEVAEYL